MTQAATLLEQAGDSAMKQKVKDVDVVFGNTAENGLFSLLLP